MEVDFNKLVEFYYSSKNYKNFVNELLTPEGLQVVLVPKKTRIAQELEKLYG